MNTNTANSQAASIDTYGDPRFEELSTALYRIGFHQAGSGDAEAKALADYIDAKLAQAREEACTELRRQDHEQACRVTHALMAECDEWKASATAAEAKLEAIRAAISNLKHPYSDDERAIYRPGYDRCKAEVMAILKQVQGAPLRKVQPAPVEGSFTREEARAAVIAVRDGCGCRRCINERGDTINGLPREMCEMILCPECGYKRCPHASDHRFACTTSNEMGQVGTLIQVDDTSGLPG